MRKTRFKYDEKYRTIAFYSISVFAICLLLVFILFRFSAFIPFFSKLTSVCMPIFVGIGIAYFLNPIVKAFEKLLKRIKTKKEHKKLYRILGILITFFLIGGIVVWAIATIVPEMINSSKNLFVNLPDYANSAFKFIKRWIDRYPELGNVISEDKLLETRNKLFSQISNFETIFNGLTSSKGFLSSITGGAISVVNVLKNILIGVIIAVYLLYTKERFVGHMKKIIFSLFNHKNASSILRLSSEANDIFSKFLVGKAIDSFIIGVITFVGLSIMNVPYTTIVSIIVGVTNMIPFFGPFIGAIPSAVLILLSSDWKMCLYFVIFIIILQQIDGNILGPMILGSSLGISAFWIMVSVIIGGGLFGVVGMILAVPLFAFIESIVERLINNRLAKKDLPIDVNDYKD